MKKTKYEMTQPKNPHQLVVSQHIFPAKSILRFTNANNAVSIHDKKHQVKRLAKPNDLIFCAKRSWDQRAEKGYMLQIENDFQNLTNRILDGDICAIGDDERKIINYFYALWYMRSRNRYLKEQEIQMKGITGDNLTKDQEEILEKKWCAFHREGGKIPARVINGMQMQFSIDCYVVNNLSNSDWGIIQAQEGEFVVPDIPSHMIIPLNPAVCLVSPSPNGMIIKSNVAEINRALVSTSQEYYFARDFLSCPL
jgi:hypothetical protein